METAKTFTEVNQGIGGYCNQYNIDSLEFHGVVVAVRFAHWGDNGRKYYEIPVTAKSQAALIAAFPGLDIQEDEPGAVLLRGCDDDTAVNVGIYAARLDGETLPAPTTPETTTDETKDMNVTEAITDALNARKDRSAWNKAVTDYALELVETLDNWDKQPGNMDELREMLLNGAEDWRAYSWGGNSLIYDEDIAERVCTASELKHVTKGGSLRQKANAREYWLDVQARALSQAARRVCGIASAFINA